MCLAHSQPSVNAAPFLTASLTVTSPFLGMKCGVTSRALNFKSKTSGYESWFFHSLTHDPGQVT